MRPSERAHYAPGERFVGRERELAQLTGALDQLADGRGRMFLVSGEPGIGKTRLADEFSAHARARGLSVIWGRSWEGAGAPAYWPIIQIIRACAERPDFARLTETLGVGIEQVAALVPELVRPAPAHGERAGSGRLDPEQARFRLFDAVATLLRSVAQREPLAIVVDDLHDADLATLQMVRFLARALKDSPVVLLGTHRETEVERSPELRALFAELVRESEQLPLRGLSVSDVGNMVRDRSGGIAPDAAFLRTLHQTTGGNPLFLGGVMQMLLAEGKLEHLGNITAADLRLPINVRSAITHQLSGLSDRTTSVLAVAAVLGIEFELAPLERAAARPAAETVDCLDEAASAGIVIAIAHSRGRWRFSHALIRSAIYDSHASKERAELHRRIAEALEQLYASNIDSHLSELAHHYTEAILTGTADKAIDYSIRAGDAASSVFAFEEAISKWESALALFDLHGGDLKRKAALLTRLGVMLQVTDTNRGLDHLEAALLSFERAGDEKSAADLHGRLGLFLSSPGALKDVARALPHLSQAESYMRNGPDTAALATVCYGLGQAAKCEFRTRDALAAMQRAMEVAQRAGAINEWCACAAQYGVYLIDHGRLSEARDVAAKVWEQIPSLSIPLSAFATFFSGFGTRSQLRDYLGGRKWLQRGLDGSLLARYQRQSLSNQLGHSALFTGELELARLRLAESADPSPPLLKFCEGNWQAPRAFFEHWFASYSRTFGPEELPFSGFYLSRVLRVQGDNSAGCAALSDILLKYPADEPHLQAEMLLRPELALHCIESGKLEAAREQVARCDEIIAGGEDWRGLAAHAAHAAAAFAAAEGRQIQAEDQFGAAVTTFARYSLVWDQADALERWGKVLVSANEKNRAIEKFDAAIEIYRRIGAGQPWIDRVMADRARSLSAPNVSPERVANANVFRKQGQYWALSFGSSEFNLRDTKGLHYIAHLLRNPGKEVAAIDLAAHAATGDSNTCERTVDLGDAGEVLDAKARADYKRRLDELREEIERMRRMNDIGALERAETEYDALTEHLTAAAGLGGRTRRTASHRDRARVAVTRSIRAAIEHIRVSNPSLGRHLAKSIRTGHFCCYAQSETMPGWQF